MAKTRGPSEAALQEAKRLADELREAWPKEFTLSAGKPGNGTKLFPELRFVADSNVPGLFAATVDPAFVMSRSRGRQGPIIRGPLPKEPSD